MKKYRKLGLKARIELTSMVDIVFLIVAFFMLSSTLDKTPAIKVALPDSITADSQVEKDMVVYITKQGRLYLNESEVTKQELGRKLNIMATEQNKELLIIKGDKEIDYSTLVSVMDIAHLAGIENLSLATFRKKR